MQHVSASATRVSARRGPPLWCCRRGLNPHTMGGSGDSPRHSCQSSPENDATSRAESDGKSRDLPRLGPINLPVRRPLADRFWEKVKRGARDECWEWQAGSRGVGYGAFKIAGKVIDAHRFAYELHRGAAPLPGIWICHTCDNRKCCNPAHLVAGTPLDNFNDMVDRGRRVAPAQISKSQRVRRDAGVIYNQKLTREKVERIRAVWAEGGHTHGSLGVLFGVDRSTIGRVVRGERWIDDVREKESA